MTMLLRKITLILILFFFILGCQKTVNDFSLDGYSKIDWSNCCGYLSASDFKMAITGKWFSVFEKSGNENVKYLELNSLGKAKIILVKNNTKNESEGNYSVRFIREVKEDFVTFAEIPIETSTRTTVLSRVNFGAHNAFPSKNIFLRIDKEPYGLLENWKFF